MKSNTITSNEKANYIIRTVKSVDKSLDYALDIVAWYTMTEKEEIAVSDIIKQNW